MALLLFVPLNDAKLICSRINFEKEFRSRIRDHNDDDEIFSVRSFD